MMSATMLLLLLASVKGDSDNTNPPLDLSTVMRSPNGTDDFLENRVPCLDKSIRYRKRPFSETVVSVQMSILAVHAMSASHMELTADVYLIHEWMDTRCKFRPLPGQGTRLTLHARTGDGNVLSHPGLANLWQPDTHLLNAKSIAKPETITHITMMGKVQSQSRLSLTASCPMDLRLFPLDRQMCSLVFQSSAHNTKEVSYDWINKTHLSFIQGLSYQDRMTPAIRLLAFRLRKSLSIPDELTFGVHDQFIVDLFLERPLGYFIWEVYMPASFIVAMSFTSFWLDRSATPARVSLGVTTVLTITTLLSSANNNLPATAYPKSIGIFLAGCFLFTFLALMEYSVASFLERRRAIKMATAIQEDVEEKCGPTNGNRKDGRRFTLAVPITDPLGLRPAAVDRYSRFVFPGFFLLFQLGYWTICMARTPQLPEDAVLLVRDQ